MTQSQFVVALRAVFGWLHSEGKNARESGGKAAKAANLLSLITTHRWHADSLSLEGELKNESYGKAKLAIALEPILDGGFGIPLMWFEYDTQVGRAELKIRVAVFHVLDETGPPEIVSVAYRFETSEGPGRHDFCHIQPITSVTREGPQIQGAVPWTNTNTPTFPVFVETPMSLLGYIVAVLYGGDKLNRAPNAVKALVGKEWRDIAERCSEKEWRYFSFSCHGEKKTLYGATRNPKIKGPEARSTIAKLANFGLYANGKVESLRERPHGEDLIRFG